MSTIRHAFGYKPPGAPAAHRTFAQLACSVADHARDLGLVVVAMKASRIANSPSQHLQLRDAQGRDWFMRLSDHHGPACTGYARPHFDLVTRDGTTGIELAFGFVRQIARGEITWSVPERARARKGIKPRWKGARR